MQIVEHYCGTCGEDGSIFFYRCDRCHAEICDDCREGEDDNLCADCAVKEQREIELEEQAARIEADKPKFPPIENVLPCMRKWLRKQLRTGATP